MRAYISLDESIDRLTDVSCRVDRAVIEVSRLHLWSLCDVASVALDQKLVHISRVEVTRDVGHVPDDVLVAGACHAVLVYALQKSLSASQVGGETLAPLAAFDHLRVVHPGEGAAYRTSELFIWLWVQFDVVLQQHHARQFKSDLVCVGHNQRGPTPVLSDASNFTAYAYQVRFE